MRIHITLLCVLLFVINCNAQRTVGLLTHERSSEDGYVLFPPLGSRNTYLIDKCGKQVRSWTSNLIAGNCAYLLEDGRLMRAGNGGNNVFASGSPGGVIELFDWNGNLQWSYTISDPTQCQHHDLVYMPNGHILAIVWELKTRAEALARGREQSRVGSSLWTEKIVEIEPVGQDSANIVWEWKVWDHLIQNTDPSKPGYDSIRNHPERININFTSPNMANPDWVHLNGIAYNADLDQIVMSSYFLNELWVIDHSTTTAEAAGRTGGLRGKGGDLLYRWGNPASYKLGQASDQKLFGVHAPYWIPKGEKDAGGIMYFNNGVNRPDGDYSSVEILFPPMDTLGNYPYVPKSLFGPSASQMVYTADSQSQFFSAIISNAQRLPGGNTLVCEGAKGYLFEIDANGHTVWSYKNPDASMIGPVNQGDDPPQNWVFKAIQYPFNYPAFSGVTLTPKAPVELNPGAYDCYFEVPTGVANSKQEAGKWTVVNPFSEQIQILSSKVSAATEVRLLNALGQSCGSWTIPAGAQSNHVLPVSASLAPGLYLLEIQAAGGIKQIERLVHH